MVSNFKATAALIVFLAVFLFYGVLAEEGAKEEAAASVEDSSEKQAQETSFDIVASPFAVYQDGAANKTIYIRGTGFTKDVSFEFEPPLGVGRRSSMTLISDQNKPMFGLKLIKGKTWLKQDPNLPFETIYVTKIVDAKNPEKVLYQPKMKVPVARVFPRPQLTAGLIPERIKSNDLDFTITGTGFSPKDTSIVFDPPLQPRIDYDFSIDPDGKSMTFSLQRGRRWRSTNGPLNVIAILGGAGRIDLPKPVTVALVTVQGSGEGADSDFETLETPEELHYIYRTYSGTSQLSLKGKGFRNDRPPTITFKPGSAVQGVDFDLTVVSSTEIVLKLRRESNGWMSKTGILTVSDLSGEPLAMPVEVAIVYDTPSVERNRKQLAYESQTVTIVVNGDGFAEGETSVGLYPELKNGEDFYISVRDATTLELELLPGKKWPRGVLSVVWVKSGECEKIYPNKDQQEKGVRIALVEPDYSGVVSIQASSQRVYQSDTETIAVEVIVLPPKFQLKDQESVAVQAEFSSADETKPVASTQVTALLTVSETHAATLTMRLLDPKKNRWLDSDGRLHLVSLTLPLGQEGKPTTFALGNANAQDSSRRGVQIAKVLPDIRINYVNPPPVVYKTHTSSIVLQGSGYTFSLSTIFNDLGEDDGDTEGEKVAQPVIFDPPLIQDEDFMVIFDSASQITFELLSGRKWRNTPGPLTLVSLDSGAGPVKVNAVIAKVAEDDVDMLCTNDCPYEAAYDGVCGDTKPDPETGELTCWGRDCADCGPRKAADKPAAPKNALCSDTCGGTYVKDGICEDGRPGVWNAQCPMCTDCSDCGPCREGGYSHLPFCTNGVEGSADQLVPGTPCVFPFTYKGVYYDGSSCVKGDGRVSGGWGWCPTTENYERDGKWGSCQYCIDVLDDPSIMDESMDYYEEDSLTSSTPGAPKRKKQMKAKADAKGFDFVRWLVNTLFFLVVFAAVGSIGFLIWRRRNGHQYQLVNSKSA